MAPEMTDKTQRGLAPPTEDHDGEGTYVITGVCGRLGKLLARQLHRLGPVVGIDRRPFPDCPKDIEHVPHPLRRKKVRDVFRRRNIRAVIHLGLMHDPRKKLETHHAWNVEGFATLLDYCATYDVPKLVLLSSASLYGGRPTNPQYLTEEAPLMAGSRFSLISDQVQVDMLAQSFFWRHPRCDTVILRPCSIVGQVNNAPTKYLRLPRVPMVMGFDPLIQLIHEQDVVAALVASVRPGLQGIFNLAGPAVAPLSGLLQRLGRQTYRVPHVVVRPIFRRAYEWKLTNFPAAELDYIQYQCLVDDARARRLLNWEPHRSMGDILTVLQEPRRLPLRRMV
jgi:UDP-glucose 4-epimerase